MKNIYFIIMAICIMTFLSCKSSNIKIDHLRNNSLECIKSGYSGNQFVDGKFINDHENTFQFSYFSVIKYYFSGNPQRQEKKNDKFKLRTIMNNSFCGDKEDMIVWLGQSTFFIRIDGKTILTDPCLSDSFFLPRLCDLPCKIEDIRNIDYLLISHNHRDHLDAETLERLNLTNTMVLVPLRLSPIVKSLNKDLAVQEAGWYQKYDTGKENIEIYCMPSKHYSKRSVFIHNESLWGSFIIKGKKKIIYFSGDAAYSHYYTDINKYFPDIDICLMPIGTYRPEWIMKDCHMTPDESIQAFHDLKAKVFIPHHYGTFDLSDEPMSESIMIIKKNENLNRINGEVRIIDIGEAYNIVNYLKSS
jgi:L-ascorbate metabolism protein UlaG (beta-lactamase superfamily)